MHDPQTGATAPPAPARAVGIVGLGAMGMGIARTLLRKGFEVHACDLREAARDAIAQAGARVHESPAQVAAQVAVLMVVVVDAAQTEAVLFGPGQAAAALAMAQIARPGTKRDSGLRSAGARVVSASMISPNRSPA